MKRVIAVTIVAALLCAMFTGCGSSNSADNGVVNVYNWGEYIDEDLLREFKAETGISVNYKTFETNEQLYSVLKQGGASYDVIIPSDYMINRLIQEDMLEKLDFNNIPNMSLLDSRYLCQSYDPTGEYTVPYMWGTVGVIYNSAVVDEADTGSWDLLWNEKYSGQILMFDNSRDAMAIALLRLGYSINTTDEAQLNEAYGLLTEQKPILQAYVMDQIFDKMESGEAAIAPYYAGDYLTMVEGNPDLKFYVPSEGSNQFVDAMCIPKGAANKTNAEIFINWMCTNSVSQANSEYVGYTSPNTEVKNTIELDAEEMSIMYPDESVISKCEYYINLPQNILELYDNLWVKLKS